MIQSLYPLAMPQSMMIAMVAAKFQGAGMFTRAMTTMKGVTMIAIPIVIMIQYHRDVTTAQRNESMSRAEPIVLT